MDIMDTFDSSGNICPMPLSAQYCLNILCDVFLGEDWYCALPLPQEQMNTVILDNILASTLKGRKWMKRNTIIGHEFGCANQRCGAWKGVDKHDE